MIRYDGVYYGGSADRFEILRFYPDGTVIFAVTNALPNFATVGSWFRAENPTISTGEFEADADSIGFNISHSVGTTGHAGKFLPGSLYLVSYTPSTAQSARREFRFVPINFGNDGHVAVAPLSQEEKYQRILELTSPFGVDAIKDAYKKLISGYHPDKVQTLGQEIKELAERKTREINEAYAYFREKYKF